MEAAINNQSVQPPSIVVSECEHCHQDYELLRFCIRCDKSLCEECFSVHGPLRLCFREEVD